MTRKIRIAIIEDEFVIAEDIHARLEQVGYEVMGIFDREETALPAILENPPDLLLVDIQLSTKSDGVNLVKHVHEQKSIPVVYITANSDQATYERARSTAPQAFLVKPFTPANLLASIDLALFNFAEKKSVDAIERHAAVVTAEEFVINSCLFIRVNGRFKKIKSEDILFAEASGSYTNIQTVEHRYTVAQNLSQFERKADLLNLIRIHRSYVVNINKVDSFEDSNIYIQNHKLPLSETYRSEFFSKIKLV
jgi:DNA-binding LytR/AlgR family response regulator